jgi:hypothetical protein
MLGCRCNNLFQTGYKQVFVPQKGETIDRVPVLPTAGKEEETSIHATRPKNFFEQRETSRKSIA